MDNPGILNLGGRTITAALSDVVLTADGESSTFIDGLADMGSVTLSANFVYGSGGTTAILRIDTSLDQGSNWIEIARFDFAQANRLADATVTGAGSSDPATVSALSAEGIRNGVLGDRLRARLTTTGTYAGNTVIEVRACVRQAGASVSTETALAAILAKLPAGPATETSLAALLALAQGSGLKIAMNSVDGSITINVANADFAGIGTTADAAVTNPASSGSTVALLKGLLTALATNHTDELQLHADIGTTLETTLAGLVSANHTDLAAILAKDETIRALLAALPLPTGAGTAANQATIITALATTHTDLIAATPAGENHVGEIGGNVGGPASPVNFGGNHAYTTGQVMGGVIELPNCARVNNGTGLLTSVRAILKVANTNQIDVFIFNTLPGGTYTDAGTFTLDANDFAKLSKVYALTNWFGAGAAVSFGQSDAQPRFFRCQDGTTKTSLWAVCVARGSITLTAAADAQLSCTLGRN